jgi:hypothetical protein
MIDEDGRSRDRLGRQVPHRLNALSFVRAIPGLKERLRLPPDGMTTVTKSGSQTIACPCGETTEIEYLGVHSCKCERTYINGGGARALIATSTT